MRRNQQAWKRFEDAVRSIIDEHRDIFGLQRVERGVTKLTTAFGHTFAVDVVAYAAKDGRSVLFECRRKGRNLTQEEAHAFAYRIIRIKGEGYFVTRLDKGLSKGAQQVADYERIGLIRVSGDATPHEYVMQYLNQTFASFLDKWKWTDSVEDEVRDGRGRVRRKGSKQKGPRRRGTARSLRRSKKRGG